MRPALTLLLVAAVLAACYNRNDLVGPDAVLVLSASPVSIPANGFSTSRIVASMSANVDRELTVTFATSRGTIVTPGMSPDTNGEVVAFLKSDATPGTALVTANVKRGEKVEASRSVAVEFAPVASGGVIRLFVTPRELPADGASSADVRAEVESGLAVKTVAFETTNGSFTPNLSAPTLKLDGVQAGSDGIARTLLYAPRQIGSALVTVTVTGFSANETVTFTPALPDHLSLRASPLAIARSETDAIRVTAALSRRPGKVTEGTRVDFSILSDVTNDSFGRFQDVRRSNADEEAMADFVPGLTAPVGLATITARVPDANLSATIKVQIQ